mgnify:CR=1 FL=1|tara:strand:+ start:6827 stop:6994 length:168 start_codon:yes stop_codon:yes gene_type:complete
MVIGLLRKRIIFPLASENGFLRDWYDILKKNKRLNSKTVKALPKGAPFSMAKLVI